MYMYIPVEGYQGKPL